MPAATSSDSGGSAARHSRPQLSPGKGKSADPAAETWGAAKAARILAGDAFGGIADIRTGTTFGRSAKQRRTEQAGEIPRPTRRC